MRAGRLIYTWMFARPRLYRLNRFLYGLALRGIGVGNYERSWASGEIPLLRRVLDTAKPGDVVLDVGANEGRFSDAVTGFRSDLRVHAFEPHPETFARLEALARKSGFRAHNVGLSDRGGTARLWDYADGGGSSHASLSRGVIADIHGGQAQATEVALTTLDAVCKEQEIDDIFLLKLDVEGAEAAALRPLAALVGAGEVGLRFAIIEFNSMNVESRTFLSDFAQMLAGYTIFRILPNGRLVDISGERIEMREIFAYQNLLFSREPFPA
jgi:FkbM family methyltransferase